MVEELRTNDAFLNHFRKFSRDFKIEDHQVGSVLSGVPLSQVMQYKKNQGVASYFFELEKRLPESYKSVLYQNVLVELLTDPVFKRDVASDLELMNVATIPYTAGLERAK